MRYSKFVAPGGSGSSASAWSNGRRWHSACVDDPAGPAGACASVTPVGAEVELRHRPAGRRCPRRAAAASVASLSSDGHRVAAARGPPGRWPSARTRTELAAGLDHEDRARMSSMRVPGRIRGTGRLRASGPGPRWSRSRSASPAMVGASEAAVGEGRRPRCPRGARDPGVWLPAAAGIDVVRHGAQVKRRSATVITGSSLLVQVPVTVKPRQSRSPRSATRGWSARRRPRRAVPDPTRRVEVAPRASQRRGHGHGGEDPGEGDAAGDEDDPAAHDRRPAPPRSRSRGGGASPPGG